MNSELNCEYPESGEAKLIKEMVKVAVERMKPQQGCIRRGQHAKATGRVVGAQSKLEKEKSHQFVEESTGKRSYCESLCLEF